MRKLLSVFVINSLIALLAISCEMRYDLSTYIVEGDTGDAGTKNISITPTYDPNLTPTVSPYPSVSITPSTTPYSSPSPSLTPSLTPTASPIPTATPTNTPTPTFTPSPTPIEPPQSVAGLQVWLRPEQIIGFPDGASLSNWIDNSGNYYDAVQTDGLAQPVKVDNVLNGLPVVRFSGAEYFNLPEFMTFPDITIIMVAKLNVNNGDFQNFYGDTGADGISYIDIYGEYSLDSAVCDVMDDYGYYVSSENTSIDILSNFRILTFKITLNTADVYVNNIIGYSDYNSLFYNVSMAGGNPPVIGKSPYDNTCFLNGDIAEMIIYDHYISAGDQDTIYNYLSTKYNIY